MLQSFQKYDFLFFELLIIFLKKSCSYKNQPANAIVVIHFTFNIDDKTNNTKHKMM